VSHLRERSGGCHKVVIAVAIAMALSTTSQTMSLKVANAEGERGKERDRERQRERRSEREKEGERMENDVQESCVNTYPSFLHRRDSPTHYTEAAQVDECEKERRRENRPFAERNGRAPSQRIVVVIVLSLSLSLSLALQSNCVSPFHSILISSVTEHEKEQ
jgi:hypothetical protein